jgi:fibronectin-binding autotransporter adhesin
MTEIFSKLRHAASSLAPAGRCLAPPRRMRLATLMAGLPWLVAAHQAQAVPVTWVGSNNGYWDSAANWSPAIPGASADVLLGTFDTEFRAASSALTVQSFTGAGRLTVSGGTLSAASASSVRVLNFTGGGIAGDGTLAVATDSIWTGGVFSGSGSTTYAADLKLSGTGSTRQIAGRTVNFMGTTTWTNSYAGCCATNYGQLVATNGAVMNNSGTWLDQLSYGVGIYTSGSSSTFNNSGRYAKTGSALTEIQSVFNNTATGSLSVSTNTLTLSGGGTLNGSVDVAGGATLALAAGSFNISGISSADGGSGLLTANGGTVNATGTNSFSGAIGTSGGTMNIGGSFRAGSFNMSSGTLGGAGALLIQGAAVWTGGTQSGNGSSTFTNALALSGSSGTRQVAGRTLNFQGTTTWTNSYAGCCATNYGQIVATNGAVLNNSGTWLDQLSYGVGIYTSGSTSTFNNSGRYAKTGSAATEIQAVFNNTASGALSVSTNTLALSGGGTLNGSVDVAGGATLALAAGSFNVSGISSAEGGSGLLTASGGTVNTTGTNSFSGAVGTSGGALNIGGSFTAGSFNMSSGTLGGAGTLLVQGGAIWTGGTMSGNGSTTFSNALVLNGMGATRQVAGRTLNFQGTTTWTNSYGGCCATNYGQIVASNGAVLNNNGTWLDQLSYGVGIYSSGSTSTFNNLGRYTKTGSAGTEIQAVFNNAADAALSVSASTLTLSGGGTLNGSVDVAGGAALALAAGSFSISGISSAEGGSGLLTASGGTTNTTGINSFSGAVGTSGGTLNVGGTFTAGSFNMSSGTVGGAGALIVQGGGVWTGGTMSGNGSTTFNDALVLSGMGATRQIAGRTLNLMGTTTWTNSYGGCCATNYGQVTVANGAVLNNSGTWLDQLSYGVGIYASGSASTFNNSGRYEKSGAVTTDLSSMRFINTGVVDVKAGTLALQATFANAGTVMGAGTVSSATFTNNGHVAPGETTGTLSLVGSFFQSASGALDIELAGLGSFDMLKVSGGATLGGVLNLICFGECSLAVGQSFKVLDAAPGLLLGSFASVTTAGFAANAFSVSYDRVNGDVLLNVTSVPEPAPWMLLAAGFCSAMLMRRRLSQGMI